MPAFVTWFSDRLRELMRAKSLSQRALAAGSQPNQTVVQGLPGSRSIGQRTGKYAPSSSLASARTPDDEAPPASWMRKEIPRFADHLLHH